jgi:predicted Ser/Thr protein kinase
MNNCPFCATPVNNNDTTCPNCGSSLSGIQLPQHAVLQRGKYQLQQVLGQGGFGITYRAYESGLDRFVAVKELFPDGSTRRGTTLIPSALLGPQGFQEALQRFLEEAKTLAQFSHPGVVRIFEVFEENNTAYLVMEHLKGQTLSQRIEAAKKLSEAEAKALALALCNALEVVHQNNLLHRDIKPDNIFLSEDGRVILIDFGSARVFSSGRTTNHTQLVTPGYAAPEQYASSAKFGPYTDIYGLGATLYHALMGIAPPSATDRFMGVALPEMPMALSQGMRQLVRNSLALTVTERPQTVAVLKKYLAGEAPPAAQAAKIPAIVAPLYVKGAVRVDETLFVATGVAYPIGDIQAIEVRGGTTGSGRDNITPYILLPGCILTFLLPPIGILLLIIGLFRGISGSVGTFKNLLGGNSGKSRLALMQNGVWVEVYSSNDPGELRDIQAAVTYAIKNTKNRKP